MRLFRTAPLVVLPLILTSCGISPDEPKAAEGKTSPGAAASASPAPTGGGDASTPTPAAPASPDAQEPTTKVKDCFDGDCLLKVTEPVDIKLDAKKYYYKKIQIVDVGEKTMTYVVDYPHGGGAQQMLGPGGSSSFGFRSYPSINVTLVSAKKGRLLVSITPGTPGG